MSETRSTGITTLRSISSLYEPSGECLAGQRAYNSALIQAHYHGFDMQLTCSWIILPSR